MIGFAPIPMVFQTIASTKLASLTNFASRVRIELTTVGFGDQLATLVTCPDIIKKSA